MNSDSCVETVEMLRRLAMNVHGVIDVVDDRNCDDIIAMLKDPERKSGEWIDIWDWNDPDTSSEGECSVCGRKSCRPLGRFCKWCGARMDEEKEKT